MRIFEITLIDGETALVNFEQRVETVDDRAAAFWRHSPGQPFKMIEKTHFDRLVWTYVIRIGSRELYCVAKGLFEFRAALNSAWSRLVSDEGVMPGTGPVRVPDDRELIALANQESIAITDQEWIADMRREMGYTHYTDGQRKAFQLALKWWYEARRLPVPADLA
jgi:hypothetical protein